LLKDIKTIAKERETMSKKITLDYNRMNDEQKAVVKTAIEARDGASLFAFAQTLLAQEWPSVDTSRAESVEVNVEADRANPYLYYWVAASPDGWLGGEEQVNRVLSEAIPHLAPVSRWATRVSGFRCTALGEVW
jgi:hypothetical protein